MAAVTVGLVCASPSTQGVPVTAPPRTSRAWTVKARYAAGRENVNAGSAPVSKTTSVSDARGEYGCIIFHLV